MPVRAPSLFLRLRLGALIGAGLVLLAPPLTARSSTDHPSVGMAVSGSDSARMLAPAGARVEAYENSGYRLVLEEGEARVDVETGPVGSRSPFKAPAPNSESDAIFRLARTLTVDADTEFNAASRILSWVARNISYHLDRGESQEAAHVLQRRTGYCTGISRLTVGLLQAVGLRAREVAGVVLANDKDGPSGYHRWVEIHFADVGWVFSDPLYSHHFVPASYLRLADESLQPAKGLEGVLIERVDNLAVVDLSPSAGPGIRARRNTTRRLAAAVQVSVATGAQGMAVLENGTRRLLHVLVGGEATFLGLEPGEYRLRVMLTGRGVVERRIEVIGVQRTTIDLAALFSSRRAQRSGATPTIGDLE